MGAMNREIAFIGDTLNTAARLVDVARDTDNDILLSGEPAAWLSLPSGLVAIPLPAARLRGKEKPLPVSALRLA
jgi:adenylate cyclase